VQWHRSLSRPAALLACVIAHVIWSQTWVFQTVGDPKHSVCLMVAACCLVGQLEPPRCTNARHTGVVYVTFAVELGDKR
jgi:hypothetical protein